MSVKFASATLAAAGTPQMLTALNPTQAAVTVNGVTYPPGSATDRVFQIVAQADPANVGTNIYIGGAAMNKTTRAGVGAVIAKGSAVNLGQYGGSFALNEIWFDGDTTGDKLLVSMVG